MRLNELFKGDRFYCLNDKKKIKYKVLSTPKFNLRHGSPTVDCWDEVNNKNVSKSGRIEVRKFETNASNNS